VLAVPVVPVPRFLQFLLMQQVYGFFFLFSMLIVVTDVLCAAERVSGECGMRQVRQLVRLRRMRLHRTQHRTRLLILYDCLLCAFPSFFIIIS